MNDAAALTFDEEENGSIIGRHNADGTRISINLSKVELIGLSEKISLSLERISSQAVMEGGAVHDIVSLPVTEVGLAHEALGENLLLTLVTPTGHRRIFALPQSAVALLIENMPLYLSEMRAANPTKQ